MADFLSGLDAGVDRLAEAAGQLIPRDLHKILANYVGDPGALRTRLLCDDDYTVA
jgi:hypothetical protein